MFLGLLLTSASVANSPSATSKSINPIDSSKKSARLSFVASFGTAISAPSGISSVEEYLSLSPSTPE
jgi:hypothetical protein